MGRKAQQKKIKENTITKKKVQLTKSTMISNTTNGKLTRAREREQPLTEEPHPKAT